MVIYLKYSVYKKKALWKYVTIILHMQNKELLRWVLQMFFSYPFLQKEQAFKCEVTKQEETFQIKTLIKHCSWSTNFQEKDFIPNNNTKMLQQNLAPKKCKVPSTKVIALGKLGRLHTISSTTLPHTLGCFLSNTKGGIP